MNWRPEDLLPPQEPKPVPTGVIILATGDMAYLHADPTKIIEALKKLEEEAKNGTD